MRRQCASGLEVEIEPAALWSAGQQGLVQSQQLLWAVVLSRKHIDVAPLPVAQYGHILCEAQHNWPGSMKPPSQIKLTRSAAEKFSTWQKKIGKRKWKFPKGGVGGVRPFGKNSQKMSFFWQAPLYVIRYNYVQLAVFFAERNHAMVGRDRCRCNKTCRTPQTCPGPPNDARCANQQDIRSLPGTIVLATDWWMDHTF